MATHVFDREAIRQLVIQLPPADLGWLMAQLISEAGNPGHADAAKQTIADAIGFNNAVNQNPK